MHFDEEMGFKFLGPGSTVFSPTNKRPPTVGQITELSPPDVHQMQQSGEEDLQNAGCTGGPSCRSMEKVVHQSASRYHTSDLAKHSRLLFETKHVHKKGLVFMS